MQCACDRYLLENVHEFYQSGGKELRQSRCAAPLEAEGCAGAECSATRTGNQEARWLLSGGCVPIRDAIAKETNTIRDAIAKEANEGPGDH